MDVRLRNRRVNAHSRTSGVNNNQLRIEAAAVTYLNERVYG